MKWKLTLVAGVLVLAALIAWATLLRKPAVPLLPVPPQNAYDTFVAAAEQIDAGVDNWRDLDEAEVARVSAANAQAIADVRAALDRESVVPLDAGSNATDLVQAALDRDRKVLRLGRAMLVASRQAALSQDAAEESAILVDLLRFSRSASRGDLLNAHTRSAALADSAIGRLVELTPDLDAAVARRVLQQLLANPLPVEDAATVVDRDIAVVMQSHSAGERLVLSSVVGSQRQQSLQRLEQVQSRVAAAAAALKLRLGLRLFQLENDRLPLKLVELVPEYLPELPVDPATGESFFYEPGDDDAYLLHRPAASDLEEQP
ncbi:MAG: hypothetical protein CMJ58_06480 [Planctomycetaceae bacterium]|nr:hypothetical protein [Planctomycetaceae bacterium]